MSDLGAARMSDGEVDRLVGLLAAAPVGPPDSASRLFEELLPLARRARARDLSHVDSLWRLLHRGRQDGRGRLTSSGTWTLRTSVRLLVLFAVIAALVIAAAFLLGGGGHPTPRPSAAPTSPTASVAGATPTPTPLAPFGYPGGGTIEYTNHDPSGNDVLWVVDPSGADPTVLKTGGCCGLFSPDGSQLALAAPGITPPGLTRDPSLLGVEVLDRPGSRVAFVVPTGCAACATLGLDYAPDAWSPNGRYIALEMWSDSDPSQAGLGIADRDFRPYAWGNARIRWTGSHPDLPIAFSPDSSMLLFMRTERTDGPTSIGPLFVLRLSDLSVRQISPPGVTVATNGLIQGPASWSPDGRTIVFAGFDEALGRTSIFAVGVTEGSPVRSLVVDAPGATSARYSPDGSLIAFDVEPTGSHFHDLYVMRADGSGQTDLTASFDPGVCCGQWSPDGRALVVAGTSSDDSHGDLFVVEADGSGIWQVTNDPNVYSGFRWGPGFR